MTGEFGSVEKEMREIYRHLMARLADLRYRRAQAGLEKLSEFWRPLPDSSPSDYLLAPNPRIRFRIVPTEEEVIQVAHFLSTNQPNLQVPALKALRYSVPHEKRAIQLIEPLLDGFQGVVSEHATETIESLKQVDPTEGKWASHAH